MSRVSSTCSVISLGSFSRRPMGVSGRSVAEARRQWRGSGSTLSMAMSTSEKPGEAMMEDVLEEGNIHFALRKQELIYSSLDFQFNCICVMALLALWSRCISHAAGVCWCLLDVVHVRVVGRRL